MKGVEITNIELPKNILELPKRIPLVAIHSIILMPKAHLPIPLTDDECLTLYQGHGYVGVLQSSYQTSQKDHFFRTGCLGRVVDMETVNHKIILDIKGICRFDVESLVESTSPMALVNYDRYEDDLKPIPTDSEPLFDRDKLIYILKQYFQRTNVEANWEDIHRATDERLVAALSMFCPLEASEKQAVLETLSVQDQSQLIMSLLEFNSLGTSSLRGPITYH